MILSQIFAGVIGLLPGGLPGTVQRGAGAPSPEMHDLYSGPVDVAIADDFERGTSTTIYRFRRDGVEFTANQLAPDTPLVRCGDSVRLEGVWSGESMRVNRVTVARRAAAGEGCSSVGPQRVAVILAGFPGTPVPATAGAVQRLLFDESWFSASTWYREVSYGKAWLSGAVFGPYTLDRAYSCGETALMQAAAVQAADRDVDFSQFERYILIFPPIRDCGFGAMSTIGCREFQSNDGAFRASWIWANHISDTAQFRDLLIHELGHSLGVGHSRLLRFPGESLAADDHRAMPVEYGDTTAVMGKGRYGDFAAAHKLEMGWLERESDVATVEHEGEYVLAPLGSESGVRALRVRRRSGVEEWLWLEYRRPREGDPARLEGGTTSGLQGVLVRREVPDSGVLTNLLDMTPATLDEARVDLGVSSERWPDLLPGSTWADPHSGLTITLGEARADGITVNVRFADSCAVPQSRDVTLAADAEKIVIPVDAAEGCEWRAVSGRSWLTAGHGKESGNEVLLKVSKAPDSLHRSGVVTVGRQTVKVTQMGPVSEMRVLSVSPPGAEMPVNARVPFLFYLRDENGVEDMQTLQLSVIPRPDSLVKPCYFRYSSARRVVEVSDDGVVFRDDESPDTGYSGACALEATIYRVSQTDIILRAFLEFAGPAGEALRLSVRAEDLDGAMAPWAPTVELNTVSSCRALPTADYFTYTSGGGLNQGLTIRASASACGWTATTDAAWIQLGENSAPDGGTLRFDVSANPDASTREGRIYVNGAPVRIIQFGRGEIQPYFVTLRPAETLVSSQPGTGALAFSYGLGDLLPAWSDDSWIKVTSVERSADRREVLFRFEGNPEASPRVGAIDIGGKTFTVLQEAGQAQ